MITSDNPCRERRTGTTRGASDTRRSSPSDVEKEICEGTDGVRHAFVNMQCFIVIGHWHWPFVHSLSGFTARDHTTQSAMSASLATLWRECKFAENVLLQNETLLPSL